MKRPWLAIVWFSLWGAFQAYAVTALLMGRWTRPEAFPEAAYNALVWPDLLFIPLYFAAAVLLFLRKQHGLYVGLFAGGAVTYVMVYLLALSGLEGLENLIADGLFLVVNSAAVVQLALRSARQT